MKGSCLREDIRVKAEEIDPIRVMRIIARMNVGGPAVQVSGLMRGIDKSRFDQRLFTGFCSEGEADYLESVATDVKAFKIVGLGRSINILSDVKALMALVKEINSFKPQIIHTHTAKAGVLGRLASMLSSQPSIRVHTFHGHLLYGYFGKIKRELIILTERFFACHTDQLLAVGKKVRDELLEVRIGTQEKFGIMAPGLVLGNLIDKEDAKSQLGLSQKVLQCAFIGRVTRIKRPDRFLDLVSEIKNRKLPIEFFIAGEGDLYEYCKNRILNEELPVKLVGWQSEIEKVLAAADLVVLTSDNEGTPLSLIQAGMAGLPVVSTNVGSVSEIVLQAKTGYLTPSKTDDLANAVQVLCSNPELREEFGTAAKDFNLSHFGVDRLVGDHQELYKQLMTNQAKS